MSSPPPGLRPQPDPWGPGTWIFLLAAVVLAVYFANNPQVDLAATAPYWTPEGGFYLKDAWWAEGMYRAIPIITILTAVTVFGVLIATRVRKAPVGVLSTRACLFILTALALGPGVVVNLIFKNQWGRPRPRHVLEFGGEWEHLPAFIPGGPCPDNCSFVAGHPSSVFWLASFGFLFLGARRYGIFGAALAAGAVAGYGRLVQGGHFLSDVIFSGFFTFGVIWILAHFVFRVPALDRSGASGR